MYGPASGGRGGEGGDSGRGGGGGRGVGGGRGERRMTVNIFYETRDTLLISFK